MKMTKEKIKSRTKTKTIHREMPTRARARPRQHKEQSCSATEVSHQDEYKEHNKGKDQARNNTTTRTMPRHRLGLKPTPEQGQ